MTRIDWLLVSFGYFISGMLLSIGIMYIVGHTPPKPEGMLSEVLTNSMMAIFALSQSFFLYCDARALADFGHSHYDDYDDY